MTPFLKEITQTFGKPFLGVHHLFSVVGVVSVTFHPVFYAVKTLDVTVFLPRFDSWDIFWQLAGRPALFLFYVAVIAALVRMKIPKQWRGFHMLMYVVLFFGIVHANLIGTDFHNFGITIIFDVLFLASVGAFFLKRLRRHLGRW
jgi:predicted ferric reductase